jgi:hypothetical protein
VKIGKFLQQAHQGNPLIQLVRAESVLTLRILDGLDCRAVPHVSDQFDLRKIPGLQAELKHDRRWENNEKEWLKSAAGAKR